MWRYTSTSPYIFLMWCLIKCMDSFTFTFKIQSFCHFACTNCTSESSFQIMQGNFLSCRNGVHSRRDVLTIHISTQSKPHHLMRMEPSCESGSLTSYTVLDSCQVDGTPASYFGGPGFKSYPEMG
jgi:hypothetical protein